MSKKINKRAAAQDLSPLKVAEKMGISKQAVMKKVHNTMKAQDPTLRGIAKRTNLLPTGLTVKQFGRYYVITVPNSYRFKKVKK